MLWLGLTLSLAGGASIHSGAYTAVTPSDQGQVLVVESDMCFSWSSAQVADGGVILPGPAAQVADGGVGWPRSSAQVADGGVGWPRSSAQVADGGVGWPRHSVAA